MVSNQGKKRPGETGIFEPVNEPCPSFPQLEAFGGGLERGLRLIGGASPLCPHWAPSSLGTGWSLRTHHFSPSDPALAGLRDFLGWRGNAGMQSDNYRQHLSEKEAPEEGTPTPATVQCLPEKTRMVPSFKWTMRLGRE